MNINDEIKRAIKHGIYLGQVSDEEEHIFLTGLNSFLISKNNFCFLTESTGTIIVSSVSEDLAEIFIHRGTLKITPLTSEGYFKIFMDTLEFISKKHEQETNNVKDKVSDQSDIDDESTEDDGEMWL
jgi:hypothetical protein